MLENRCYSKNVTFKLKNKTKHVSIKNLLQVYFSKSWKYIIYINLILLKIVKDIRGNYF